VPKAWLETEVLAGLLTELLAEQGQDSGTCEPGIAVDEPPGSRRIARSANRQPGPDKDKFSVRQTENMTVDKP
jgi:hypothetical protein